MVVMLLMLVVTLARWVGRAVRILVGAARGRPYRGTGARSTPAGDRVAEFTREEAECLLAADLLSGLIEREEYQDSLAALARADDARSPLSVPSLHGE
ncbi:hypothetical protein [Kitasatospora sp. NPDC051164]|uniref:hypothetical protein n=1 Tax=Kitasatospora sp. NPDC051164 TaxID=3364055 RepID=UPI0037A4CBF3